VEKLIATLRRTVGNPVSLDELILSLSDGIIGTVALGSMCGGDKFSHNNNSFQHTLDEAMEMLSGSSAEDLFPKAVGRLVDRLTGFVARRERVFNQLDAFFEMVIESHLDPNRAPPQNGGDLIDVLIGIVNENRGITRDHVKAIIFVCYYYSISFILN
jgi:4-hydroxyphenylacetaldehyde oxime monooxygenase